jgi:hypothetical protein
VLLTRTWIATAIGLMLGCAASTGREASLRASDDASSEAVLRAAAAELMTACWPEEGDSASRVLLQFTREDGKLSAVEFEARDGASNAVGRCAQHIAFAFPWGGQFPETMELTPPMVRPSGWTYLAHLGLLNREMPADRGVLEPGPLVRACLGFGELRAGLRFRMHPPPTKVSAFVERMNVKTPADLRTDSEPLLTDAERCVAAVLSSTVYPMSKAIELDFTHLDAAPAPAGAAEVAHYFPPTIAEYPMGSLSPDAVQAAVGRGHEEIARCWDQALKRRTGLAGARTLKLRLSPSGQVLFTQVAPNQSDTAEEAFDFVLDRCLVGAISKVAFPAPKGGAADVTYSWVFAHR